MGYLKFDLSKLLHKVHVARTVVKAEMFKPELDEFTRKSLNTAVRITPVRSLEIIRKNQKKQYDNRVNYIPSIHHKTDPMLIVKKGRHYFKCNGVWYRPDRRKLPNTVWARYQRFLAEHNRRKATAKSEFVKQRAQARFLWARSWFFIGLSIGLKIITTKAVYMSVTRRKPPEDPPSGHAEYVTKRDSLEVKIYNPFLQSKSKYNVCKPQAILKEATEPHKKNYYRNLQRSLVKILKGIFET